MPNLPTELVTSVALCTMRCFMLMHGFRPCDGWEPRDRHCHTVTGEHEIWTLGGKYLGVDEPDIDALRDDLCTYYQNLRSYPASLSQFNVFDCEMIEECWEPKVYYIFISIYL